MLRRLLGVVAPADEFEPGAATRPNRFAKAAVDAKDPRQPA